MCQQETKNPGHHLTELSPRRRTHEREGPTRPVPKSVQPPRLSPVEGIGLIATRA